MSMDTLVLLLYALGGTLMSSVLSCIPALHIYNVAGLLIVISLRMQGIIPDEALAMWMLGMVVGYAILNTIPSIFLAARTRARSGSSCGAKVPRAAAWL